MVMLSRGVNEQDGDKSGMLNYDTTKLLPNYSMLIPPFLKRKEDNTWLYPQLHEEKEFQCQEQPSQTLKPIIGGLSGQMIGKKPDITIETPNLTGLPDDPLERLALVAQMRKLEPPKLRKLSAWEIARKEAAKKRINKMLAKKHGSDMPLSGKDALRKIFGEG